jgi:predicted cobalt transporter CbtA
MNALKKLIGGFAMGVGVALGYLLLRQALTELAAPTATTETRVFWGVILPIALVIVAGLVLFGYYAVRGEYQKS